MGVLYLLHFSEPLHHARHYLGFTAGISAARRVSQHRAGRGGPLTRAARRSGIELYLAWQAEGEQRRRASVEAL